jgi:hypothetical protein
MPVSHLLHSHPLGEGETEVFGPEVLGEKIEKEVGKVPAVLPSFSSTSPLCILERFLFGWISSNPSTEGFDPMPFRFAVPLESGRSSAEL